MTPMDSRKWIVLRLFAVGVTAWGIAAYPRAESNLNWTAAFMISLFFSTILFGWLISIRHRDAVQWSYPFDVGTPFLPMKRYPLRFWVVTASSMMLGGGISLMMSLVGTDTHYAFGGTFLLLGLGALFSVIAFLNVKG